MAWRTIEAPVTWKETRVVNDGVIASFGDVSVQGRRWEMEDTHIILPNFRGSEFFAGVYDGHYGRQVADYAAASLHRILRSNLNKGILPQPALRQAFLETDSQIKKLEIPEGATTVTAYIKDRTLYVANAGDARAVLGRKNGVLRLSHDHKPDNPEERKRIESLGGIVGRRDSWDVPRVNLKLAPSRSLGDHFFDEQFLGVDLITAEPYITETQLEEGDDVLILACDGVWDVLTDEEAVDIVRKTRKPKTKSKLELAGSMEIWNFATVNATKLTEEAAVKLKDEALEKGSTDNITAIVIKLSV